MNLLTLMIVLYFGQDFVDSAEPAKDFVDLVISGRVLMSW